jgi:hypothetical protein
MSIAGLPFGVFTGQLQALLKVRPAMFFSIPNLLLPSKPPHPEGIERGVAVSLHSPPYSRALPRPTTPISNSYENITVSPTDSVQEP